MKIFIAVSRRYARSLIEVISSLKPKPYVVVMSYDDDVEILARSMGFEFMKIKDIEKIYTYEKLEEFDVAIAALDDDVMNVACIRIAKSMGIPIAMSLMHNEMNKDSLMREGVQNIINLNNFIVENIKFALMSDVWITIEIVPMYRIVAALHKLVKRSVLGLDLKVLKEAIDIRDVGVFAIDSMGRFIGEDRVLESGDIIVVIGAEDKVLKTVTNIEKIFRRYEQIYSIRYSDIQRIGYG